MASTQGQTAMAYEAQISFNALEQALRAMQMDFLAVFAPLVFGLYPKMARSDHRIRKY
jgi:hypothetical protein